MGKAAKAHRAKSLNRNKRVSDTKNKQKKEYNAFIQKLIAEQKNGAFDDANTVPLEMETVSDFGIVDGDAVDIPTAEESKEDIVENKEM